MDQGRAWASSLAVLVGHGLFVGIRGRFGWINERFSGSVSSFNCGGGGSTQEPSWLGVVNGGCGSR